MNASGLPHKLNMVRYITAVFILMFMYGCGSYNYIRQDVQTPCFVKKQTFRGNINISLHHVEPLLAYSIVPSLGITGSCFWSPLNSTNNRDLWSNFSSEAGLVYYHQILKNKFSMNKLAPFFDINAGLGMGKCNNTDHRIFNTIYERNNTRWNKWYLQTNVYFVHKPDNERFNNSLHFGIGTKLNMCYYQYLNRYDFVSDNTSDIVPPLLLSVKRTANDFIMPVQDFYIFFSKDIAIFEKTGVNVSLKLGYTYAYSKVNYSSRDIEFIDRNHLNLQDEFTGKSEPLRFKNESDTYKKEFKDINALLNLLISISVGIKI